MGVATYIFHSLCITHTKVFNLFECVSYRPKFGFTASFVVTVDDGMQHLQKVCSLVSGTLSHRRKISGQLS